MKIARAFARLAEHTAGDEAVPLALVPPRVWNALDMHITEPAFKSLTVDDRRVVRTVIEVLRRSRKHGEPVFVKELMLEAASLTKPLRLIALQRMPELLERARNLRLVVQIPDDGVAP